LVQGGETLCQHVPQAATTQSRPARCEAGVSCIVSPSVLYHIHCVFGSLSIHRARGWAPLPAKLWLSRISLTLIRASRARIGALGARIGSSRAHRTSSVVRVVRVWLFHVHGVALRRRSRCRVPMWWVTWGSGPWARVRRGLLKIHR